MAFNDFTVEFSVNLTCNNCVERTTEVLSRTEGISDFTVDLDQQSVVVTSSLPASLLKTLIESTGKRAVVVGLGSSKRPNLGSAVAALGGAMGHCTSESAVGVIRFVQMDENTCLVDGVVDGLRPYGNHALAVHECGDLSGGCYSLGPHFNPRGVRHGSPQNDVNSRHAGDLGNVTADSNGRASFRFTDPVLKVWDIIGRSVVVAENQDDMGQTYHPRSKVDGNCGQPLTCGIIARSAGLFQNAKKFCACDGVTIWDERNRPIAGKNRRQDGQSHL